jgi:MYXO-CTERM domain-containing protein
MKSLSSLLVTSALIAASTTASAALVAGDIALVGFQASGSPSDSFSFATLVNVDAGTVLYFTDNGFSTGASAGFRGVTGGPTPAADNDGNEGLIKYTVGANGLAAGQVVSSLSTNTANGAWTLTGLIYGTTVGSGSYAPLSFSASGEQFTVFQSSNAQPMLSGYTALYNFDNTGAYEAASSSSTGQLAPGLVQGTSAVLLSNTTNSFQNFNFAAFSGQADRATWLARIGNVANWTFAGTSAVPVATNVADGSFSVTPVPSPGAAALMVLAGLVARRRR